MTAKRTIVGLALFAIALALSFPAAAQALSGEITVAAWPDWADPSKEGMQKALAAFQEAYPDIKVTVLRYTTDEYDDKIVTMIAGGVTPDVTWMEPGRITTWGIQNGWLADLTPFIERSTAIDFDRLIQRGMIYPPYEGRVYGIGTHTYAYAFFYNKDHYDEAGLAYPRRGWTWDDFLSNVQQLTRPEIPRYGFEFDDSTNRLRPWVWQGGGDWWNPSDLSEFLWHLPESMLGLQFQADLLCVYGVAAPRGNIRFERGTASIRSTTMSLLNNPPGFAVGVATPPKGPAAEAATVNLEGWAIFEQSNNKEAAWAWVEWWASPEGQEVIADVIGEVPAYVPAIQNSAFAALDPAMRREAVDVMVAMAEIGRAKLDSALFDAARTPFMQELAKVWRCEQTVQAAVDRSIDASRGIVAEIKARLGL